MEAEETAPLLAYAKDVPLWRRLAEAFWNSGRACLFTAPLLLFLTNVTASALTQSLPFMEVLLLRSVVVVALVFFFQTLQKGTPQLGLGQKTGRVLVHTFTAAVGSVTAFAAVSMIPLADALTLFYGNLAITALCGWLLGLERLLWYGFVGVVLCVVGIVFVVQPSYVFSDADSGQKSRDVGMALAVANSLLMSVTLLLKRTIGTSLRPDLLVLFNTVVMIPVGLLSLLVAVPEGPDLGVTPWQWLLLAINSFGSYAAMLCINRGVALVSGTLASICASFQMLLAHIADFLLFHESFSIRVLIGTLCMLSGSIATTLALRTSS